MKKAILWSIVVLKMYISKAIVKKIDKPDQITTTTLKGIVSSAFLKPIVLKIKNITPIRFIRQSKTPFDLVK
jgi:hypothetical protein